MLFLNILAGYSGFKILGNVKDKRTNTEYWLQPVLCLGLSFLFKIVAVFDFAAFAGFLVFCQLLQKLTGIFLKVETISNEIKNLGAVYSRLFCTNYTYRRFLCRKRSHLGFYEGDFI